MEDMEDEDRARIRRLERMVRLLTFGLLVSVVGAAGAVAYAAWPAEDVVAGVGEFEEIVLGEGVHLELRDSDLRITLPDAESGVFLHAPDGSEIARLGGPAMRHLGD